MLTCNCEECDGTGQIRCPECDGAGGKRGSIETIKLDKAMHNYAELLALQKDAARVRRQTEELKQRNPARTDSYHAQFTATLAAIEKLADAAAKKK
jgi:DnaJ-class molecular chaperone